MIDLQKKKRREYRQTVKKNTSEKNKIKKTAGA